MFSIGFFIETLLLGVALAMDCFTVGITCGLQKTIKIERALLMAFLFGFFQSAMFLSGSIAGGIFKDAVVTIGHWVACSLLFIIGLKMVMDSRSYSIKTKTFDVSQIRVLLLLSIATSIDAFVTGIGMIMNHNVGQNILACFIIGIVTFVLSLIGWKSGERVNFVKPPFALFIGGMILIAIGVKSIIVHYL